MLIVVVFLRIKNLCDNTMSVGLNMSNQNTLLFRRTVSFTTVEGINFKTACSNDVCSEGREEIFHFCAS